VTYSSNLRLIAKIRKHTSKLGKKIDDRDHGEDDLALKLENVGCVLLTYVSDNPNDVSVSFFFIPLVPTLSYLPTILVHFCLCFFFFVVTTGILTFRRNGTVVTNFCKETTRFIF